jgi:hypothetical protein
MVRVNPDPYLVLGATTNHAASNAETHQKTGPRCKPCLGTPLNDVPRHDNRAPGRIRTCDTGFRRAVLYPLSYEGERPKGRCEFSGDVENHAMPGPTQRLRIRSTAVLAALR